MTGKLTTLIAETDRLTVTKRAELRGRIPQRASPAIPLDPHPSRPCPPRRAASMSGSIKARERHRPWRCTQPSGGGFVPRAVRACRVTQRPSVLSGTRSSRHRVAVGMRGGRTRGSRCTNCVPCA